MTLEALAMPLDIPWRRLAYSADMVDRRFELVGLPPRWRSSIAVFGHVVPIEDTEDRYPDTRIVYLRLTCSLTGWSPAGALGDSVPIESEADRWGDWQRTAWETILGSGWAERYWPCVGAIAQVAVYPRGIDEPTLDDFPYISDFEPKKRELYETVTETGEVLSGSSDRLTVGKGESQTDTTEKSHSIGASISKSIPGAGLLLEGSYEYGHRSSSNHETYETRATDTSRERRETQSHTTTTQE